MSDFGTMLTPRAHAASTAASGAMGPIPKGERHYHYVGMWDGAWQDWRMHDECYAASTGDSYVSLEDGFTPGEGEMPERVKALVEELSTDEKVTPR